MLNKIFYLVLLGRCFASSQPGIAASIEALRPYCPWDTHKAWVAENLF